MLRNSRGNNSFEKLVWRVDMRSLSNKSSEINEPIARIHFITSTNHDVKDIAGFEMTRDDVSKMLDTCQSIQKKFDEAAL